MTSTGIQGRVQVVLEDAAPAVLVSAEVVRRVRAGGAEVADDYLGHLRVYSALMRLRDRGLAVRVRKGHWTAAVA